MIKSTIKKGLKAAINKYPLIDMVIRKIQIKVFDWGGLLMRPRVLQFRENPKDQILFVDVSFLVLEDLKTGIQRVTRSVLMQLLNDPPNGFAIQAVYADRKVGYKSARVIQTSAHDLSITASLDKEPIRVAKGDIFFGLDFATTVTLREQHYLTQLKAMGVKVYFVIYDLLPIQFPGYFPAQRQEFHKRWLRAVSKFDGVLCISQTTEDDYRNWLRNNEIVTPPNFDIAYFHLGGDLKCSAPTKGKPEDASRVLKKLVSKPSFLMVGTLEPRKGHQHIIEAFSILWSE
jgi:glycosyltransferase involved in cell wall biosynthesis